jgi:adenosine deaminase
MAGIDRVIGLGLDGNEEVLGRTSHKFVEAFERAAELGLGRSAHCGESSGAWGVWDGLNYLNLDRVDHGVRAIEDPKFVEHLAENGVALTICPTSNVIVGLHKSVADGPIDALYKAGVPVTVNSDDPQAMQLSINDDLMNVSRAFGWTIDDVMRVQENAIDAAYCDAETKAALLQNQHAYAKAAEY